MAKKNPYPHLGVFEKYDTLLKDFPEVERKGATMPYTALNGNMFSFLDKDGMLSLRFSKEEQLAFIKEFETIHSIQHGSIMNGYAIVPESVFNDSKALMAQFAKSLAFVKTLKPKATKKKK